MSGKVRVTVGGKAEGGTIAAGYIVGCQVGVGVSGGGNAGASYEPPSVETSGGDLAGIDLGTGAAIYDPTTTTTTGPGVTPSADVGASLSLGSGQTAYVPIIQLADDDDDAVNDYTFTGRRVASPTARSASTSKAARLRRGEGQDHGCRRDRVRQGCCGRLRSSVQPGLTLGPEGGPLKRGVFEPHLHSQYLK